MSLMQSPIGDLIAVFRLRAVRGRKPNQEYRSHLPILSLSCLEWQTSRPEIDEVRPKPLRPTYSKYPPAEPGALGLEPLKAAYGAADAAPERVGHLKVAISATDSSAPGACPPLPVS